MNTDALLNSFAFQRHYLGLLVNDIPDSQLTAQPGLVVNHPAWQLGHLAWVTDNFVGLLGGTKTFTDAQTKLFAQNTTPLPDRAAYPAKSDLLQLLDQRRTVLVAQCKALTDADWQKPHPIEPLLKTLPTLWQCLHFLLLTHESTHLGQLATWRRAQGLPMALGKL